MIRDAMEIGVLVERRRLKNPWVDHAWVPNGVLVGIPAAAPWTVLGETAEATRFYAGPFRLEFFSTDTGSYRDNLRSGRPALWISLRTGDTPPGVVLHTVTADPAEGEALTETGTDIVEAVPMPDALQVRLAAFVKAHHVERPFVKRKRDRGDPQAMSRRSGRSGLPEGEQ